MAILVFIVNFYFGYSINGALLFLEKDCTINCQRVRIEVDTLSIDCIRTLKNGSMIISSQLEYNKLNIYREGTNCEPLPYIDFNRKVLLGYSVETRGCSQPKCLFDIMDNGNEYVLHVDIITEGICSRLFRKVFWVLIDKPSSEVNIRFEEE